MYQQDFYIYERRRKRSKRKIIGSFFILCIGVFLVFSLIKSIPIIYKQSSAIVSPIASGINSIVQKIHANNNGLQQVVQESLTGAKGDYSIAIKNLKTGESYYYNEHEVYESASLYKLWIMGTIYQQIQNNQLSEDDPLSESVESLNATFNIASQEAELSEGIESFSVAGALNQMITISHNYAAMLLTSKVGATKAQAFLTMHGFNESHIVTVGAPTTTASDIELFFEDLYNGKLANPQYTTEMLDLLKGQRLNSKLPKYLPDQLNIAHKTGELGTYSHDAGIVYSDKGPYIIVIMSNTKYPPAAVVHIAQIS